MQKSGSFSSYMHVNGVVVTSHPLRYRRSLLLLSVVVPRLSSMNPTDEDIQPTDTTVALQGLITRARARQLNYQVLSFLGTMGNLNENMMLPKSVVLMLIRNEGPTRDTGNGSESNFEDDGTRAKGNGAATTTRIREAAAT